MKPKIKKEKEIEISELLQELPRESRLRNVTIDDEARTYEKKIIKQKKESFKYRTSNKDERSVDDKIKTKQLLKNINLDQLFNRRMLL